MRERDACELEIVWMGGRGRVTGLRGGRIHDCVSRPGSVEACNRVLRVTSASNVLLVAAETSLSERSLRRLLFHSRSDPLAAVVHPASNCVAGRALRLASPKAFERKNFDGHLGYGLPVHRIVQVSGVCMLVKRSLFSVAGYPDGRFSTTAYAWFDLALRARQAGFRAVYAPECFAYREPAAGSPGDPAKDHSLLYEKWHAAGTDFLECIGPPPGQRERW